MRDGWPKLFTWERISRRSVLCSKLRERDRQWGSTRSEAYDSPSECRSSDSVAWMKAPQANWPGPVFTESLASARCSAPRIRRWRPGTSSEDFLERKRSRPPPRSAGKKDCDSQPAPRGKLQGGERER